MRESTFACVALLNFIFCLIVQLIIDWLVLRCFCLAPPLSLYLHLSPYGGNRCPLSCRKDWFTHKCTHTHNSQKFRLYAPHKTTYIICTIQIIHQIHKHLPDLLCKTLTYHTCYHTNQESGGLAFLIFASVKRWGRLFTLDYTYFKPQLCVFVWIEQTWDHMFTKWPLGIGHLWQRHASCFSFIRGFVLESKKNGVWHQGSKISWYSEHYKPLLWILWNQLKLAKT